MPEDEVGSLGQETLKLFRALAVDTESVAGAVRDAPDRDDPETGAGGGSQHVCTTSWCPVCQVVGFVKDNPEVVEEVALAALHLARTVRDAFEAATRTAAPADDEEETRP
ncbi:hypothetical protein QE370_002345 [Aeromicrobium sp. SORGH_AS981]|uniref:hypothetical protein n=1 Tax=Aeromicrobium sp. SORGH_AS_0981 TaxID=3041802 RepID=UPI0028565365|nr:hypothetical protein [Aeromicrobium sp. SORGH_AS_0981]MDR6119161.1 hypothetical protein [Aeromicrobium sp. SORGH_AS_0981]